METEEPKIHDSISKTEVNSETNQNQAVTQAPIVDESVDTSSSPQAVDPALPINPTIESPPPKSKKLMMAVVVAILLLIGLGAWLTLHKSKPKTASNTPTVAVVDHSTLRVGTIIDENGVAADKKEFMPFINYLVSQLKSQGITKGEFVPDTSVSNMAKLMREGKVDVYIDSIFPVFVADRLAGSQIIANRWKDGVEKYHTAIFVKKGSTIKTTNDLKGKIIGFDSSTSTVGYFLPKAELTKLGYKLTEKQKTTDAVAADEIGYVFVHGEVFNDVVGGITSAGAESEQEIRDHFGPTFDQQYRVVMTTPDVLRFLVTGRKDLNPGLRAKIKATLLAMDQTAGGKVALKSFSNTAKFSDVGTDSDAVYGEIQKLTDQIEDEIVRGGVGASAQQ